MRAIVRSHTAASFHAENDADKALLGMWAEMVASIGSSGGPAGETNDVLISFKTLSTPLTVTVINDNFSPWRNASDHPARLANDEMGVNIWKRDVLAYTNKKRFVIATFYAAGKTGAMWGELEDEEEEVVKWVELP